MSLISISIGISGKFTFVVEYTTYVVRLTHKCGILHTIFFDFDNDS